MFQKLRRKFILINMSIVTLVLASVLFLLCFSSHRRFLTESFNALNRSLEMGPIPPPIEPGQKEKRAPFDLIPVFITVLDGDNHVTQILQSSQEVTLELAQEAVDAALAYGENSGKLKNLSLRYLMEEKEGTLCIAFVDTIREESSMQNLILTSCLILLGSMCLLFIISWFLAGWALGPARKAWEEQNRFVADASHELKTPLTVILANLKILLSHPDETIKSQQRWIQNTQEEASRMQKLVKNLLFLARSEEEPLPQSTSPVNFSDLLWSSLLPFESLAFEQGVTLSEDIAPDLWVLGDAQQLRQLALILLDNACKYAGLEKKVRAVLSSSQDKVCLRVSNTGEPIPQEELPRLFDRFYRTDKSRSRKEGGYGLGLSIALRIIKGHHGKIRVTSDAENGTCFAVYLPLCSKKT